MAVVTVLTGLNNNEAPGWPWKEILQEIDSRRRAALALVSKGKNDRGEGGSHVPRAKFIKLKSNYNKALHKEA